MSRTWSLVVVALVASAGPSLAEELRDALAAERQRIELIERTSAAFVAIGGGSGVVISPDGWVLTNDHVAGSRKVGSTWVVIGLTLLIAILCFVFDLVFQKFFQIINVLETTGS